MSTPEISPLASVHPDAQIGDNVTIEPFAVVKQNTVIGDNCWIGSGAVIDSGARIGKGCSIFHGAVIASIPQDLKFDGEETTAELGDNVSVREYVTVNRGTVYNHKTEVGSGCLLMAYVHVGHDSILGENVILANSVNLAGHVVIEDFARIGGLTGVHQFCHIGKHAFIASGCLARKDIPPFVTAGREPLAYAGVNSVGLKRAGYAPEVIHDIQQIHRILFQNGHTVTKAISIIEEEFPDSTHRDEILDFVRKSERGLIRGYN